MARARSLCGQCFGACITLDLTSDLCSADCRGGCCAARDEDGTGKGDGLVTYLKPPSVDLAVQILDGTALRDGDSQLMSVSQVCAASENA